MAQDINRDVEGAERHRRRRGRSIAIALILAGMVVLFYVITIIRLGPGVLERPL